jgi:hypothetical protein
MFSYGTFIKNIQYLSKACEEIARAVQQLVALGALPHEEGVRSDTVAEKTVKVMGRVRDTGHRRRETL